jgi:hypothetical protein
MRCRSVHANLLAISLLAYSENVGFAQETSVHPVDSARPVDGETSREDALNDLRVALKASSSPIRVNYSSPCEPGIGATLWLPTISIHMPAVGETGLAAINDIFRGNVNVRVAVARSGLTEVTIGDPQTRILQTTIALLTLTSVEQYNPIMIIAKIETSDEMQVAMHKLGISPAFRSWNYIPITPASGLPHFPSSQNNMTVDQLLDSLAVTFKEGIIYGDCAPQRVFEISTSSTVSRVARPQRLEIGAGPRN